jgi:hypothetical protein
MTGLALQFNGLTGWQLFPGLTTTGMDATVQNALVLIATPRGGSIIDPTQGSTLLSAGLYGLMASPTAAQHQANFAAAEVKEAVNDSTSDGTGLSDLYLQLSALNPPAVYFNALFISTTQEQRGLTISA